MRQQRTIVDDLRTKEGLIDEHKKKIIELQVQLKDFATAYEVGQLVITGTVYGEEYM